MDEFYWKAWLRLHSGLSAAIVNAILADMTDRRGLKQEWMAIDVDIQLEIMTRWIGLVEAILEPTTKKETTDE